MKTPNTIGKAEAPPRLRLKLSTVGDVRAELARIYREGKAGLRPIADVSRLGNVLFILHRIIEGSDLEKRIQILESGES